MTPPTPEASPNPAGLPSLTISQIEAEGLLKDRVEFADNHLCSQITSGLDLSKRKTEYKAWNDYNRDLLQKIFTDDSRLKEYDGRRRYYVVTGRSQPLYEQIDEFYGDVKRKRDCLDSIKSRLSLYSEPKINIQGAFSDASRKYGSTIFLVHGHDIGTRETVARFLQNLKLDVMILSEQVEEGRTIIEKFEDCCQDAGFAVVIMTPDDRGGSNKETEMHPRARQNVILELGYFMAYLGRPRVVVIHKGEVEPPSDIHGLVYLPFDEHDGWKRRLTKELIKAGFSLNPADAL